MSLYKISIRGLLARSLYKLPIRGQRFLYEMPRLVRACAVEMHMDMSSEPCGLEIYTENAVHPRTATPVLCEPAQSKCTWTCHQSFLMREFTGKMPRAPWPRHPFCASLRSRNAYGHFTIRTILCGFFGENAGREGYPLTVRTPSVWPHCLGNKMYNTMRECHRKYQLSSSMIKTILHHYYIISN